ncbi:hypothetical protein HMPREF3230_01213 [Gardnerella vaginalis]|uniref:RNA polymerase sigma factor 70 region 4 type 2 domain-containing protein n=2 Tax=Gardnerella vaginalis TaxID=2702 RepID=A0A135Z353_GARVA|nr:hypothetical protein HMPREF3230_01213 [Gardnerella vaginalis]
MTATSASFTKKIKKPSVFILSQGYLIGGGLFMNMEEQRKVKLLRDEGLSYTQIANRMDISVNTIKSYCKRNSLGVIQSTKTQTELCESCSKPIKQNTGRKVKRFCSDACRNTWWNKHTQLVKRQANYECTCLNCKNSFISYGNKTRKYCCHACYIEHRFGGGHHANQ